MKLFVFAFLRHSFFTDPSGARFSRLPLSGIDNPQLSLCASGFDPGYSFFLCPDIWGLDKNHDRADRALPEGFSLNPFDQKTGPPGGRSIVKAGRPGRRRIPRNGERPFLQEKEKGVYSLSMIALKTKSRFPGPGPWDCYGSQDRSGLPLRME